MTAPRGSWLKRFTRVGLLAGFCAGLAPAVWMTWRDWRLNPGGLFQGPSGTHWSIVLETAWSWFWPIALAVFSAVLLLATLWHAISRKM